MCVCVCVRMSVPLSTWEIAIWCSFQAWNHLPELQQPRATVRTCMCVHTHHHLSHINCIYCACIKKNKVTKRSRLRQEIGKCVNFHLPRIMYSILLQIYNTAAQSLYWLYRLFSYCGTVLGLNIHIYSNDHFFSLLRVAATCSWGTGTWAPFLPLILSDSIRQDKPPW